MNKQISVSLDTFSMIWASRIAGESSEDEVIYRVFKEFSKAKFEKKGGLVGPAITEGGANIEPSDGEFVGVVDQRSHTRFQAGLKILRRFKNRIFTAIAQDGYWELEERPGEKFLTLNQLSRAIGVPSENAWINWKFIDETKQLKTVNVLRKQQHAEWKKKLLQRVKVEGENMQTSIDGVSTDWIGDVVIAMERLGAYAPEGKALKEIYEMIGEVRAMAGHSLPPSYEAITRRVLEESSSDSDSYKHKDDLFTMTKGKGNGFWALRKRKD